VERKGSGEANRSFLPLKRVLKKSASAHDIVKFPVGGRERKGSGA